MTKESKEVDFSEYLKTSCEGYFRWQDTCMYRIKDGTYSFVCFGDTGPSGPSPSSEPPQEEPKPYVPEYEQAFYCYLSWKSEKPFQDMKKKLEEHKIYTREEVQPQYEKFVKPEFQKQHDELIEKRNKAREQIDALLEQAEALGMDVDEDIQDYSLQEKFSIPNEWFETKLVETTYKLTIFARQDSKLFVLPLPRGVEKSKM